MFADWSPAVALALVGVLGDPMGTTRSDGADGSLVPTPLVSVTVNV